MEPEQTPPQGLATEEALAAAAGTTATVPAATESPESAAPAPATEIDWESEIRTRLADIPPERLYEWHPGLRDDFNGRTGRLAQQQAEQIAAARTQEAMTRYQIATEQARQQAEMDRLAKEDPYAFAERYQQTKDQGARQQSLQQQIVSAQQAAAAHLDQTVLLPTMQKLPEAEQAEVWQRWQQGYYVPPIGPGGFPDWNQARVNFRDDVMDRYAEHKSTAKVSDAEKRHAKQLEERLAALRTELLGTAAEAEGAVDTGGGAAGGGGVPSPAQYASASAEQRKEWNARIPDLRHRWAAGKRG
jgi:hypothetical protein